MNAFVLDCSIAASWLFEDEAAPETDALLRRLEVDKGLVPGIWRLEIGNVLVQAERRKRIAPAQVATFLRLVERLPIVVDEEMDDRTLERTLALARAEELTTYDAAYLDLAMRRGTELATLDKELIRAARRSGVATLPA